MPQRNKEFFEFDNFRLDVSERLLWRGTERLTLPDKAFETLCVLVRRSNRLVTKEELLSEVWADVIVEENNLDKSISLLRQVLGERAGTGKFIETVRGHGYRFVTQVHKINDAEAGKSLTTIKLTDLPQATVAAPSIEQLSRVGIDENVPARTDIGAQKVGNELSSVEQTRLIALGIFVLIILGSLLAYYWRERVRFAPSPQISTIAVLPFRALLPDQRNEALEIGITDALISKLSGNEAITVRPLSSVRKYTATERDSASVGRDLQTHAILDGSIQTSGERIRITAQLIRTSDGKQLWADKFEDKFTDIFMIQDVIAERVASALKIRLQIRPYRHDTANIEAYQLYMKGRFHGFKAVKSEIETGITYFKQAIEADPSYALAYVGLADAYRALAVGGEMPAGVLFPKAKAAVDKAIQIDDQLVEAHAILGHILFWYEWNWSAAEKQYKRALELDANNTDALYLYAHFLSNMGRHMEALPMVKRARQLDPLNLRINSLEGLFFLHAGQTDEAIASLQKTLSLDANSRLANIFAARAYDAKEMFTEAIAAANKAKELSIGTTEPIAYGAYALAKAGKLVEARAALDGLLKLSTTQFVPPYHIALVYNGLGEQDKALDYLEKAFEQNDVRMVFLKVEPTFKNLRSTPRFTELSRRMRFE